MSILNLLKTGPAMAAMGTVGAGGTVLTLWGTGVIGGEVRDYPDYNPLPTSKDAKAFMEVDENKLKQQFSPLKSGNATFSDAATQSNNYFGDISTKCLNKMFSGVQFHSPSNFKLNPNKEEKPEGLEPITASKAKGLVQGCYTMSMSRLGHYFLMTSEMAIRRGNRGIVLWTGVKNAQAPFQDTTNNIKIHIRQFIAFFSYNESRKSWDTYGGYSWGGKNNIVKDEKWIFKSPDGKTTINIDGSESGPTSETHNFYYGTWKPGKSQTKLFELHKEPFESKSTEFRPNKAQGFSKANAFFETSNDYDDSRKYWKQYCKDDDECGDKVVEVDMEENMNMWFEPFKDQTGSWV